MLPVAGGLFAHIEAAVFCGDPVTKLHAGNRYFTDRDMPSGRGYPLSLEEIR